MPSPIGSQYPVVTIPPVLIEGDANAATPLASSPTAVTIPPVHIEGSAGGEPSVQQLVKTHDTAKAARGCSSEGATAAFGALEVVGAAIGTVLAAALGPLGVAGGLAATAGVSYGEGQKLRALYNCETE